MSGEIKVELKEFIPGFPFLSLPKELQFVVLQLFDIVDILHLSQACKELCEMCKSDSIWRRLCVDLWPDLEYLNIERPRKYLYERAVFLTKNQLEWKNREIMVNQPPSPRQSFTGNYVKGKIIYIGGQTSVTVRFDDIFYFDVEKRIFKKPRLTGGTTPPKFARHAAVDVNNKIFVFGGYDGFGQFFGLGVYDVDKECWYYPEVNGTTPTPRTNHAIASIKNKIYLFGGNDTTLPDSLSNSQLKFGTYGDFQVFDTETFTWSEPETKGKRPCARSGHHMLSIGSKIYLFGGGLWNDKSKAWVEKYTDMFVYDADENEWFEIHQQNPSNNAFISLPHWKLGHFIFVYHDPLWCFDTVTSTWHVIATKGHKPPKRFLGPATAVPDKHCAYMFGGVYTQVMNNFDQLRWSTNIFEILKVMQEEDIKKYKVGPEQPVS